MNGELLGAMECPGMLATFNAMVNGRSIAVSSTRLPNMPGCPQNDHFDSDSMTGSSDSMDPPEWVEFVWQEPQHPAFWRGFYASEEDLRNAIQRKSRDLPSKSERVPVRNRIPEGVLKEIAACRAATPKGEIPDKKLWVHFVWTPEGIRIRWRLVTSRYVELHSGGDDIAAP